MENIKSPNIKNDMILKDHYRSAWSMIGSMCLVLILLAPLSNGRNAAGFSIVWGITSALVLFLIANQRRDWVFRVSLDGVWKLTVNRLFKNIEISGTSKDIRSVEILNCDYGEFTVSYIAIEIMERGHFWIKSSDDEDLFKDSIGFAGAANKLSVIFGLPNAVKESSSNSRDGDALLQLA
jgi:hypothetical protein